ncbi:DUF5710 domain-containing protein [Halomonas elongata]|uniref:DUF5710 domain-containing protein n=1 Tax=Halomonas elongata TaxID=2746 RepID=UPI0033491896
MARIDLNVPYSQKDEAKKLGAKWDPKIKKWYIKDSLALGVFEKWLPPQYTSLMESGSPVYVLRSSYYYIVESYAICWRCREMTSVHSFMLPSPHEEFECYDEEIVGESGSGRWEARYHNTILSSLVGIPSTVLDKLCLVTKRYFPTYSKKAGYTYYMNHCEHCDAVQGDFYMHSEPGGAFCPVSVEQAGIMYRHRIDEFFQGNAGASYSTFDFMPYMKEK